MLLSFLLICYTYDSSSSFTFRKMGKNVMFEVGITVVFLVAHIGAYESTDESGTWMKNIDIVD